MRLAFRPIPYLLAVLLVPYLAIAQVYPLEKVDVVASGGGSSSSGGALYLRDTVGESFIGQMGTAGFGSPAGYWYLVDEMHIGPTSAVLITSFELTSSLEGVALSWNIGSADGLVGFNIYRSTDEIGGFTRINEVLIPAGNEGDYVDSEVRPGWQYWYRLGAVDRDGEFFSVTTMVRTPTGEFTLFQNHPNPFNPSTTISFYLPETGRALLAVYSVQGQRVAELLDETRGYGMHEVVWDGTDDRGTQVSSGIYFYRLTAGSGSITKKLVVLK